MDEFSFLCETAAAIGGIRLCEALDVEREIVLYDARGARAKGTGGLIAGGRSL
jgi:hypothetical protein